MNKVKIFAIVLVALVVIMVATFVYRNYIEFKNADVRMLINAEASGWAGQETVAAEIIHDACMHILSDRYLTAQVRSIAKATGVSKEKALVDAAVAQCYAHKYFNA